MSRGSPPGEPAAPVLAAAREFAVAHDLTDGLAAGPGGLDGADLVMPAPLAGLLGAARPAEVAWWRAVAEAWQEAGLPGLARASARRAWGLARDGTPAGWADLQAVAELLARLGPNGHGDPGARAVPGSGGGLDRESQETKQSRLRLLFGRSPEGGARADAMRDAEDVERLLMCTLRPDPATLARVWHRTGYDRLVVEQFFARIAGQPLPSWLGENTEPLIWSGWSFHRLGDQATARACFKLAVALENEEPPVPADPQQPGPGEPLLSAYDYLARFPETAGQTAEPAGAEPCVAGYARLASWLEERGLHGYLPWLVRRDPPMRSRIRKSTIALPLRAVGEREGWYLDRIRALTQPESWSLAEILDQVGSGAGGPQAPRRVPPTPCPRPLDGGSSRSRAAGWTRPAPLRATSHDDGGTAIPIGVTETGGRAALRIRPAEPVLLVCAPAADAVAEAVADHLGGQGWAVLWARQGGPAGPGEPAGRGDRDGRWHRVRPAALRADTSEFWLRELAEFAPLRRAAGQCLRATLPAADLDDPAALACIDAAIASAGEEATAEMLLTGGVANIRRHAAVIVDRTARLAFAGPGDIRRAAALHEATVAALQAIRRAVCVTWEVPEQTAGDPCPRVRAELPADARHDAALLATLTAGSLLRTAEICRRNPERNPAAAFADFTVEARPRDEPTMTPEEVAEFVHAVQSAAGRPGDAGPGHDARPGDGDQPPDLLALDNPWVNNEVLAAGTGRRVCVMVTGSLGTGLQSVLGWFRPGGLAGDHAMMTCIPAPHDDDMRAASAYRAVLAGPLPPDLLLLLEIGAGIRLAPALVADLGRHGAVHLPAPAGGGRPERLIVLPMPSDGR
jgi:hypothetical protein